MWNAWAEKLFEGVFANCSLSPKLAPTGSRPGSMPIKRRRCGSPRCRCCGSLQPSARAAGYTSTASSPRAPSPSQRCVDSERRSSSQSRPRGDGLGGRRRLTLDARRQRRPEYRWSVLKSQAKRRRLTCDLPFDFFHELIRRPCHYCGAQTEKLVPEVRGTQPRWFQSIAGSPICSCS